jgi:hypothetical protein
MAGVLEKGQQLSYLPLRRGWTRLLTERHRGHSCPRADEASPSPPNLCR